MTGSNEADWCCWGTPVAVLSLEAVCGYRVCTVKGATVHKKRKRPPLQHCPRNCIIRAQVAHLACKTAFHLVNMHCIAKLLLTQHSRYKVMLNVLHVQTRLHPYHPDIKHNRWKSVTPQQQLLTMVATITLAFTHILSTECRDGKVVCPATESE